MSWQLFYDTLYTVNQIYEALPELSETLLYED
jgi:hypothetical protein